MKQVKYTVENNLAERRLVESILQGNTRAFGVVIKNTEGLVAQIVFKMVHNAEDRKDLVQDIYLKAFHHLAKFRFESKLLTWIGHIAFNSCANYLEKKKLSLTGLTQSNETLVREHETEILLAQKQLKKILASGIEKLSPLYKTIISLYHQEEMNYADIIEITGLPEGTLKSYLARARKALKENILNEYKKEEL